MKLLSLTRRVAAPLALALTFLGAQAVEPTQANRKYANYYYAYPYPENPLPQLTAAPKGYEPFHIEHYGRHGSRWHIGSWVYRQPIDLLRPAERNGKLTPRGVELMKQLRKTEKQSRGRSGELTPLGARQHRGIAERMTRNFPEVFKGDANVDAKSTVVIRCVLSMENELRALQAFNPDLNITSDASGATMFYMNNENDSITNAKVSSEAAKKALKEYKKDYPSDYSFIDLIISDPQFAKDSIKIPELRSALLRVTNNSQSLEEPTPTWDLFSEDALKEDAMRGDASWFISYGNSDLTEGAAPLRQRYLLYNMIESADTSIMSEKPSANLRFGHDVVVVPLVTLIDLEGYGRKVNDLNELDSFWHLYDLTPMATNVQMVFYRPKGRKYTADDVLVKVLFNEKEVTLPAKKFNGPYYKWSDVRKAYLDRIGDTGLPPVQKDY